MTRADFNTSRYQHSPSAKIYAATPLVYPQGTSTIIYDSFLWNDISSYDFSQRRWNALKAGRVQIGLAVNFEVLNSTNVPNFVHFDFSVNDSNDIQKQAGRFYQNNNLQQSFYSVTGVLLSYVDVDDYITFTINTGFSGGLRLAGDSKGALNNASVHYLI